jgi:hypothetical protein
MCPSEWLTTRNDFEPVRAGETLTREEFENSVYSALLTASYSQMKTKRKL